MPYQAEHQDPVTYPSLPNMEDLERRDAAEKVVDAIVAPSLMTAWLEAITSTANTLRYIVSNRTFWHDYGALVGAGACVAMVVAQPREIRQSMSLVSYMTMMSASAAGGHFFGKYAPLVLCSYAGIKMYSRSQ